MKISFEQDCDCNISKKEESKLRKRLSDNLKYKALGSIMPTCPICKKKFKGNLT